MQEWIADPICATIRVTEEHIKESLKIEDVSYHWQSRWEIKNHFNADKDPEGMKMADGVCNKAKESQQNPDFPGDANWMMHLVPKSHVVSNIDSELHRQGVRVQGTVTDPEAAQMLLNVASASTIRDFADGAPKAKSKATNLRRIILQLQF